MLTRCSVLLAVTAALALYLAACGSRRATDQQTTPPGPVPAAAAAALGSFPAPQTLLARHSSGGGADLRRDAASTDPNLPPQHVVAGAPLLAFQPDYTAASSDPAGLAYAMYRLNSSGFAGSPTLRLGWTVPPDSGTAWIGLANVAANTWQWSGLPVTNVLPLPGGVGPHSAANGDFLILVAITGSSNDCTLSYIRLGNEPPHPVLITLNGGGPLPLATSFDATSSADIDGTIASYQIDFGEGAGFQPMPAGQAQHSYTVQGTFTATLRLTDNEGAQAEQTTQIDAGVPPNQPPVATLSANALKGPPGTTLSFDASASSDPDGTIADWEWDPEGDGSYLFNFIPGGSNTRTWMYTQPGTYHPTVRVTDDKGASSTASKTVTISYGTLLAGKVLDNIGGEYPSIGTANGKLCVAFVQANQLAFVRATATAGDTWFAPQLLGTAGIGCSLATVTGQPAIAYHDGSDSAKFVRANNADGTTWASPFTIASSSDIFGFYPSLTMVNGKPAATFCDATGGFSGITWYAQATNNTGTAWGSKRKVSASGQTGFCAGLITLTDGTPCACTLRTAGLDVDQLQFALANDTNGSVWNPPIPLVDGKVVIGLSHGVVVVAGRPAMAFFDLDAGKVKYLRAKDADGLSWNTPVEVAAASQAGGNLSLAVVNGLPVIAFLDTAGGIQLSTAINAAGTGWNPPVTVDAATTNILEAVSLTEFSGVPAIAYGDKNSLKFAYWH